jgi:hypothetical protein
MSYTENFLTAIDTIQRYLKTNYKVQVTINTKRDMHLTVSTQSPLVTQTITFPIEMFTDFNAIRLEMSTYNADDSLQCTLLQNNDIITEETAKSMSKNNIQNMMDILIEDKGHSNLLPQSTSSNARVLQIVERLITHML